MFTVVALGPVACYTNGTRSQLTTVNIEGIIDVQENDRKPIIANMHDPIYT